MVNDCGARSENTEKGYKCRVCGFMWGSGEGKDTCPACGAQCDARHCKVVDSSNEDF